jgi:transposase
MLGVKVVQCRPADPESKGLVERANGYLETSFLPGRSFGSPQDFNSQLSEWVAKANCRLHRALGCRPADRIDADRAAMVALPPVAPTVGWRITTRLPRDHYVRLDANDYSVHPSAVGRRVDVTADAHQVAVSCDGRPVARHDRCWARHQTITDPAHRQAAEELRAAHRQAAATRIPSQVQTRDLADYDRVFGVDSGEAA